MAIEAQAAALTRDAVNQVSDAQREPDWLRERRHAAWDIYESSPEPSRSDEEWRRTDLRWLKWNELTPSLPSGTAGDVPASVPLDDLAPAVVVHIDHAGTRVIDVSAEARNSGLVVMDLAVAAREHPDLVRDHLATTAITPDQGKFQALSAALWSGGVLVHLPRGVSLAQPIAVNVSATAPTALPRVLITAAEESHANVVEWWAASEDGRSSLLTASTELFADDGANLAYTHVHLLGADVRSLFAQHAIVGRDATFTSTNVATGGRFHKARVETTITDPGANVVMNGAFRLAGCQFIDHHTLQDHQAPDGASDLRFAGVLAGAARSVYAGTITVEPHAQRTSAYQNNRNLLLQKGTRADSIPRLEIMADDVRCTHGATTSTVEPSHLYYLRSRGLDEAQAQSLIVQGYFEAVLDRVPHEGLRDVLRHVLTAPQQGADHAGG